MRWHLGLWPRSAGLFDRDGDGLAIVLPAGESPLVWKPLALGWLDRLDLAFDAVEKDAGAIRLVYER